MLSGEHIFDNHTDMGVKEINSNFHIEIMSRNRGVAVKLI